MKKPFLTLLVGILMVGVVLIFAGCARASQGAGSADPQMLLIPRWFLSELTVNGEKVDIPAGQQTMTIQFEEGGKANGTGGCNSFGTEYQAGTDGKLRFGPITATLMACDDLQKETAYFQALEQVRQFKVEEGRLTLSSDDGKALLIFSMPPK